MTADAPATIRIRPPRRWDGWPQVKLEWQRLRHQAHLHYTWWTRPHTPFQAVFVLATHRSGSNLLIDYLNKLPGVQSHSEILCRLFTNGPAWYQRGPRLTIGHIRRMLHLLTAENRGCKLMLDQLEFSRVKLTDLFAAFPNAKFIVLYRQSLAEQYVSLQVAQATRQFRLGEGEQQQRIKIQVDAAELRHYCDDMRRRYHTTVHQPSLQGKAVLLSYEELTAEPHYWLEQHICPLLKVPFVAPETRVRKQNTRSLAEQVTNYSEVAALLRSPLCQHKYQWPGQQTRRRAA